MGRHSFDGQALLMTKLGEMHADIRETRDLALKTNGRVTTLEKVNEESLKIRKEGFERLGKVETAVFGKEQTEQKRRWWAEWFAKYGLQALAFLLSIFTLWVTRSPAKVLP